MKMLEILNLFNENKGVIKRRNRIFRRKEMKKL